MGYRDEELPRAFRSVEYSSYPFSTGVAAHPPPPVLPSLPALARIIAVPAAVVLRKIATIINADAHPLPRPYRNIRQKAVVHQDEYKLEVRSTPCVRACVAWGFCFLPTFLTVNMLYLVHRTE